MSIFRISAALAAAVLMAALAGTVTTDPVGAQSGGCAVNPVELAVDAEEQAALDAINALRAGAGLTSLSLSSMLGQAAAHKSQSMAVTGTLSHTDADGRNHVRRVADCGYRASPIVSETLAMGLPGGRAITQMWRDSAAHHVILIDPANRAIGIARVRDAGGTYWWTAVFAHALDAAAPASPPAPAPSPTSPPANPTPAVDPGGDSLQPGGTARVNAGRGECLNIRAAPGRAAAIVGCLTDGTLVRLSRGPMPADGITWWQVDGLGWIAGEYLDPM